MATSQSTKAGQGSSDKGGHYLVPHNHAAGTLSRQEPLYDSINVYANGQLIALYNAASTPGGGSQNKVGPVTIADAVQNEDGEDTSRGKAEADRFLAEGRITRQEYDAIVKDVKPKGTGVPPGTPKTGKDVAEVNISGLSYSTVLTPNGTTLGQLIKNVTFPRTIPKLADNVQKLPVQNIVNNLAALAVNIIEPTKKQYPNALITNTYREGAGQAQHGTGQAADIQFRGIKAHDYFNIVKWMSENLPYDQLLLEYLPNQTVWAHVSYAIPNLPYGGIWVRKNKPINRLGTLNGAAGGRFLVNLHQDVLVASVPNRIVAA